MQFKYVDSSVIYQQSLSIVNVFIDNLFYFQYLVEQEPYKPTLAKKYTLFACMYIYQ